ncbi:MAG: phosphatidate cytidylyltransferase [Betaproteobacteria bacterium]|jgi:phosphatidate cytidylyltransferase|nr:phosphatidate cytidylyltransferase [Betaproteobacteria bacterium]MBP6646092.1 phosphatidate cytidylyltransferase [Burkholderiaceae bacterium]
MNQYLLHMTVSQQVGALFILVFGALLIASVTVFVLSIREFEEGDPVGVAHRQALKEYNSVLNASWLMMGVFWVAWAAGDTVATVLFGLVAFFTLREFITLSPTRRGDHRSLLLAFFVVLPIQFALVAWRRFDLFSVFIPVYVFLLIPVVSALADDPHRFLERNAKLQWGIMVCVYGLSHVPALLLLEFPHRESFAGRNAFLVFFLVLSVQICMVVQHFASIQLKAKPTAPNISKSFTWRAWLTGVLAGGMLGGLFAGITPFAPGQAMAMALIACAAGSLGHLVMKALKRDRGVIHWGAEGKSVTGAGGLLDRVDALCFAAPVFFHSVRWYFGL